MTVTQLVEIANILESYMPLDAAREIEQFLITAPNVRIVAVSKKDCAEAMRIAREKEVGLSDCITFVAMRREGVEEIYSFNRDFDRLGVKRVEE